MTLHRFLIPFFLLSAAFAVAEEKEPATPQPVAKVWIFVAVDCPIANGYAPEFSRLQDDFGRDGVAFTLVYPEPSLEENAIASHLRDYALSFDYHHDNKHSFVEKCGATTTPEVAVFDVKGALVYRGKIDNRYSEFGDRRNSATETYLRDVLIRLLSGEVVEFHETEPIGCYIEALPEN